MTTTTALPTTATAPEPPTLYERLGGAPGIATIIDQFYVRLFNDPELAPYFLNVPVETLLRMQKEFFGATLDGPQTYTGLSLAHTHGGRGITVAAFTRFARYLLETLEAHGVSTQDVDGVVSRIAMYADDVTSDGSHGE